MFRPWQGTHLLYTGIGDKMGTKLDRIRELAVGNPGMKFTALYHHINKELLLECHKEISGNKAVGVDRVTKSEYEVNLEENLTALVERLKRKNYRPSPSLRVNIEEIKGKIRPLGISAYEDKIVQLALHKVLEAVYEPKFHNSMFGFRQNRGQHDALRALNQQIEFGKTNFVLDADIRGYFNNMTHERILELIAHKIGDPNILWLIKKILTAGVIEEGKRRPSVRGTEQGNIASPIISNIYMHYALALWFEIKFKPQCRGEAGLVIFADDFVVTFQYKSDAENFLKKIKERFTLFGLELHETKTRLVEFGRFAKIDREKRGEGKPETFDFLGFTHYCSESKTGKFRVKRKTSKKKAKAKLQEVNKWLRENCHLRLKDLFEKLSRKLRGHYQYYGITDNVKAISNHLHKVESYLFKWLNRRSQEKSYTWEGFREMRKIFTLPRPKIHVSIYADQFKKI